MSRPKPNPTKAELDSVREIAKTGDANANFRVGYWYETGEGFTQNHKAALIYYKVAAKQGMADAQSRAAGVILELSKQDRTQLVSYKQAVDYAKKAAVQGHGGAKVILTTIWREMIENVSDGLQTDFRFAAKGIKPSEAGAIAQDIFQFIHDLSKKTPAKAAPSADR